LVHVEFKSLVCMINLIERFRRQALLLALQPPHNGTLLHDIDASSSHRPQVRLPSGWKRVYQLLLRKQNRNNNKLLPRYNDEQVFDNDTSSMHFPILVSGIVFSDFLFHSHFIATLEFPRKFLKVDNVERRDYNSFDVEAFRNEFEIPNIPVVFTNYPIYKKFKNKDNMNMSNSITAIPQCESKGEEGGGEISLADLTSKFPVVKVHASGYNLSMQEFAAYWYIDLLNISFVYIIYL
jgi:hypothetical protein